MNQVPHVSVILPAFHSSATLASSLSALEEQTFRDFEVIVVDSSPDPAPAARIVERFPDVRFDHHAQRLLPHEARNVGAAKARGDILAFSDPDCRADPRWLERLVAAHAEGHGAVGGAVESLPGFRNRAIHLAKYPWWLPGGEPAGRPEIPSANSSWSRDLWDNVGPYRGDRFAGDSELSWRARRAGHELWFEPRASITHLDHGPLGAFLRDRVMRGRDFGRTRAEARRFSRLECAARLLALPVTPLVMVARAARFAVGSGRPWTWAATVPVQLAAAACWCAGEAVSHWRALWRPSAGS